MKRYIPYLYLLLCVACGGTTDAKLPKQSLDDNIQPQTVRGFMVETAESVDKKTLVDAKSWGANVVRLQLNPLSYAIKRKRNFWEAFPDYLKLVQTKIDDARQVGLKVVVDLHEPPMMDGDKAPTSTKQGTEAFWENPELKTNFIRMWKAIATKFKSSKYNDVIWGYDLFNEPQINWKHPPKQWLEMSPELVATVRAIDKDVWIVYQSGLDHHEYKTYEPLKDKRVIYSVHFYKPFGFTHQGVEKIFGADSLSREQALAAIQNKYPGDYYGQHWDRSMMEADLRPVADFAQKYHVPIFVGEFSAIAWAPIECSTAWLRDAVHTFEKYNFSWCYHAFREWSGWSLEHAEGTNAFWFKHDPKPAPVNYETQRAKVIKEGLKKNQTN
mgnify:CR=1 FL=1